MSRKKVTISNFEQDSAADLIQLACCYDSEIILENRQYHVNAKSLMGIMAFRPAPGTTINIITNGNDEYEAADAVEQFLVCADAHGRQGSRREQCP